MIFEIIYLGSVISLLDEFGAAFGEKFSPYITDLCPYLINVVQNDTKERELTKQVAKLYVIIINLTLVH